MRIPILQIDAFTSDPFKGNPAAVCVVLGGQAITVLRGALLC